eukprot:GEMP01014138.1.p1 GENE.GEMP01014138.1~~GEMP01014138.1.p1  ORF type:complete len:617 (+),score=160.96 GEMP01014138.1:96-1946(+)
MDVATLPEFAGASADEFVTQLPKSMRFLANLVEEVLRNVDDKIFALEQMRSTKEYEHKLREISASARIEVLGSISCMSGGPLITVGTSLGYVVLIDPKRMRTLESPLPRFETPVRFIKQTSYGPLRLVIAREECKLVCVCLLIRGTLTTAIRPLCVIELPWEEPPEAEEEMKKDDDDEDVKKEKKPAGPTIEQIEVAGTVDYTWVAVLWKEIYIYACPLGELKDTHGDPVDTIPEHPEEKDENEDHTNAWSPDRTKRIAQCVYRIKPPWEDVSIAFLWVTSMPEVAGRAKYIFISSREKSEVASVILPHLEKPRLESLDDLADVKDAILPEDMVLEVDRRWNLGDYVSARAVGEKSHLAFGTARGIVQLFCKYSCRMLAPMPAHFAAVLCLQFDGTMLVSGAADHWIHIYNCETQMLVARHLFSPPPSKAPVVDLVCASTTVMGLDDDSACRVFNVNSREKVARVNAAACRFVAGSGNAFAAAYEEAELRAGMERGALSVVLLFDVASLARDEKDVVATVPSSVKSSSPTTGRAPRQRSTKTKSKLKSSDRMMASPLTEDSLEKFDNPSSTSKPSEEIAVDMWQHAVAKRLRGVHADKVIRNGRIEKRFFDDRSTR